MQGFKSFADRTRLEFGAGVCAVIGPNGSGKSNVVEAIRWATHGARARELRAGRGTELIFHGSGGKAPLGLAEVTLELQTTQGRVNVARRVYRDGSAEQDLNGRGVRARDVQAALRGTGLGPGGLAVIGQGEVSGVVQAEGKTLLGYLQEAAGLSRAVAVRQETEGRLQGAEGHLSQLQLLLAERQAAAERLGRAATQARAHRDLTLRVLTLEDALRRERQAGLLREITQARSEAQAAQASSAELARQVQAAAERVETVREAAQQARLRRDAHAGALETLRAAREAHAQAERYRQHLQTEAENLGHELEQLPGRAPLDPVPDLIALNEAVQQSRAEAEQAEMRARRLDAELTRARTLAAQAAEASARANASADTLKAELERAEGNLDNVQQALAAAHTLLLRAQESRASAEQAYAGLSASRSQLQGRERHLQAEQARLNASLAPLRRERERLEQTLNSYARYGEGARNALRLEHPGIVGSVADLLSVPAEYETALSAALGRRLEQVVVQTGDDARQIIEELKRVGGRATFLPLDIIRARARRDGPLLREEGVIGNLADLCPTDPPLVGEAVLADTLLVRDLRAANRLARAHANRPRLVTLDGELVEPGGAITGGRLRDTGSAVLGDQRRFQELDAEIETLEQGVQATAAGLESAQRELTQGAQQHDHWLQERENAAQQERAADRQVTELSAQQRSLGANRDRLLASLGSETSTPSSHPDLPDLEALEADLLTARRQAEQGRAAERDALEELTLARELDAAWKAFQTAQTRAASLRSRLDSNRQARQVQDSHLEAAHAEMMRRQDAVGRLDEQEFPRLEAAREQAAQEYANLIGAQNKLRTRLEELHVLVARREGSLEPVPDGCSPAGTPREWNAELNRARQALEDMGPVNARAEADYTLELQLLEAQQAELNDAALASAELRRHLGDLETVEAHATDAAFTRVNAAFREYSAELLGGLGELEQERGDTGRLTGLRLAVQPKGKRTRSMNLLSAGERTMAGLGFLFALNHAGGEEGMGGLPLAVLDEVDAPLDEANIRRFTAFLERFGQRGTQFLLVTHQKATMEVAQALWGVTTDQSGASRVLSIRQREEQLGV